MPVNFSVIFNNYAETNTVSKQKLVLFSAKERFCFATIKFILQACSGLFNLNYIQALFAKTWNLRCPTANFSFHHCFGLYQSRC